MPNGTGVGRSFDESAGAALAPAIGVGGDPQRLFPDEDAGASASTPPEPDRFALFPDEAGLAREPRHRRTTVAAPPLMFERTTADRLGGEPRTLTVTPRLIALAVILFVAAFAGVRSCQLVAAASTAAVPATPR